MAAAVTTPAVAQAVALSSKVRSGYCQQDVTFLNLNTRSVDKIVALQEIAVSLQDCRFRL
jgi:hypothetical protein